MKIVLHISSLLLEHLGKDTTRDPHSSQNSQLVSIRMSGTLTGTPFSNLGM